MDVGLGFEAIRVIDAYRDNMSEPPLAVAEIMNDAEAAMASGPQETKRRRQSEWSKARSQHKFATTLITRTADYSAGGLLKCDQIRPITSYFKTVVLCTILEPHLLRGAVGPWRQLEVRGCGLVS